MESSSINELNRSFALIPVTVIKGVGQKRAEDLLKLNIETVRDLLYHFPRLYLDRQNMSPMNRIKPDETVLIEGNVIKISESGMFPKIKINVEISDGKGRMLLVWFNQPYMKNQFALGQKILAFGKVVFFKNRLQLINPEIERPEKEDQFRRIVPIYPLTEGVSQRFLRNIITEALCDFPECMIDPVPEEIASRHGFPAYKESLEKIHFPSSIDETGKYRKRFVFEELFLFGLISAVRKKISQNENIKGLSIRGEIIRKFTEKMPFQLTDGQRQALREIYYDMENDGRMMRLLQGDVGCGKTLVAYIALLKAIENGRHGFFMTPTEVLAEQQYEQFREWSSMIDLPCYLYTAGLSAAAKREVEEAIRSGTPAIITGTVALLNQRIDAGNTGLLVIDEQHKFGVMQRARLVLRSSSNLLVMTATPIPRSLALTLYGDLDLSVIKDMPSGRKRISTRIITEDDLVKVYNEIRDATARGEKTFFVFPAISADEDSDIKAAIQGYRHLLKNIFPDRKVILLHGGMSSIEKREARQEFTCGKCEIMAATSIIEVGIDVRKATIIVIMNADRFGLTQIHQLRGRVGRSDIESRCYLVGSRKMTDEAKERLNAAVKCKSGFELAEEDLRIRGQGDIFGLRQHGFIKLKIADLQKDFNMLKTAREEAFLVAGKEAYKNLPAMLLVNEKLDYCFGTEGG
ncbi:MAG: ATP-dependent DNA helicase RecG [Candidatus Coatesbacteria bacterium]|nr:ATP-dependent DNA helicase RecG [Candidatus Coatesbacteria bacterium]